MLVSSEWVGEWVSVRLTRCQVEWGVDSTFVAPMLRVRDRLGLLPMGKAVSCSGWWWGQACNTAVSQDCSTHCACTRWPHALTQAISDYVAPVSFPSIIPHTQITRACAHTTRHTERVFTHTHTHTYTHTYCAARPSLLRARLACGRYDVAEPRLGGRGAGLEGGTVSCHRLPSLTPSPRTLPQSGAALTWCLVCRMLSLWAIAAPGMSSKYVLNTKQLTGYTLHNYPRVSWRTAQ